MIRYRMNHGLSQQELADRVGSSLTQINRIESGKFALSIETLLRIAHALDLKLVLGFERQVAGRESERDLIAL